jgi:GAF domain
MVELIFRLSIAALVAASSRQTGTPPFELAYMITTAYAFWSIACALLSRKWLVLGSSFQLLADVSAIGVFTGASGALNGFGFLAVIPAIYSINRRQAHPIMASVAGMSMYLGFALFAKGVPALDFHAKALAITLAGCFAVPKRQVAVASEPVVAESVEVAAVEQTSPELEDLRSTHERLLERQRRLEEQVVRDRAAKELVSFRPESDPHHELARKIAEVTGSEAVVIYVRAESADDLVVQGTYGEWPTVLRDTAIPLLPGEKADGMRWAIESQVSGLLDEGHHSTTLLHREDRVIGLVVARCDQSNPLCLDEFSEIVSTHIIEIAEKSRIQNRLRESEIQYAVASVTQGAITADSLAERAVRELSTLVRADSMSIVWTYDGEAQVAATQGESLDVIPILSLRQGLGLDGWLHAGAPEIAAFRTMVDPHCNPGEAMHSRIGSFILIPLQSGPTPFGFLVAATHRSGGLDTADLLALRTLGIELSRTISRLNQPVVEEGLVTPTEFHELTRVGGAIVYIEPIRSEGAQIDQAVRQFSHVVRGKLPTTGIVCRRDQDDLLAFLSGFSHDDAVSWANEIQALASMISTGNKPLAVRTKVAYLPNRVISAA